MANSRITTPHAAVLIWNYVERFGLDKPTDGEQSIDQIIISTYSLRSIATSKQKGRAGGSFKFVLAPTKNWVSTITNGSWCVILMSRQPFTKDDLSGKSINKVDPKKLKFLGRITNVRMGTDIDQQTGTRSTNYIVEGVDWSDCFNNTMYLDPYMYKIGEGPGVAANYAILETYFNNSLNAVKATQPKQTTISNKCSTQVHDIINNSGSTGYTLTIDRLIDGIFAIWKDGLKAVDGVDKTLKGVDSKLVTKSIMSPTMPKELARFLGLINDAGTNDLDLVDYIHRSYGKLTPKENSSNTNDLSRPFDAYTPVYDGLGLPQLENFRGSHTVWSLLELHCNSALNELIPEIRWENDYEGPRLTLYKRIRPFIIDEGRVKIDAVFVGDAQGGANSTSNPDDPTMSLVSRFQDIRRHFIPTTDVMSVDVGTNWMDKINFIEMVPSFGDSANALIVPIKAECQFYDVQAIKREGFRPKFVKLFQWAQDLPTPGSTAKTMIAWKYLLKEWYFDLHRVLNGTINIIGQDRYIQVGDNIMVNATAFGYSPNFNKAQVTSTPPTFILAHVETINQNFTINKDGKKSFITTIGFVRGILVDHNADPLVGPDKSFRYTNEGKLDQNASILSGKEESNNRVVATVLDSSVRNEHEDPTPVPKKRN